VVPDSGHLLTSSNREKVNTGPPCGVPAQSKVGRNHTLSNATLAGCYRDRDCHRVRLFVTEERRVAIEIAMSKDANSCDYVILSVDGQKERKMQETERRNRHETEWVSSRSCTDTRRIDP
jgi:hypothetical protein